MKTLVVKLKVKIQADPDDIELIEESVSELIEDAFGPVEDFSCVICEEEDDEELNEEDE